MPDQIDRVFKAIADPTRREILNILVVAVSALSITQITQRFDISRQGITKHIKSLEDAGLVSLSEQGREKFCHAKPIKLKLVQDWVTAYEHFWNNKMDDLGEYLDKKYSKNQNSKS